MRGFDAKFLEELKSRNEIISVASKYVNLEQRGTNFWGRCPFHHEKTASFCINGTGQYYYCFGCHKSGDVITLIMELEALDFNDAVKFLAERVKMELPENNYDGEKIKEQKEKKSATLSLLRETALFYVGNLRSEKSVKHWEYLKKRGISAEYAAKFGIGASLSFDALPKHLLAKGYSYEEMLRSGAVDVKDGRYYDALGGRLIIPIINQFGEVVAFGGRLLEKADFAKYKNTKETIVFSKSNILYNINNLKKIKNEKGLSEIIIVEGYMDAISLVSGGFENVAASMGTSLTKEQARILKRYTENVLISYDGDFAGQKASVRGLEILKDEGLNVKVVSLPDGLDPDDVIRTRGAEGYAACLKGAKPLIDFKLDIVRRTFDVNTVEGKRKYIVQALRVVNESESVSEQEDLLKEIRKITGITYESLKRELDNLSLKKTAPDKPPSVVTDFGESVGERNNQAERFVLSAYLFSRQYALETDIRDLEFFHEPHGKIKDFILNSLENGGKIKPNLLYDFIDEEYRDDVSKLLSLGFDDDKKFDAEKYFRDCVKTLKCSVLDKKIEMLSRMVTEETDVDKRRAVIEELQKSTLEKNKLKFN